MDGMNLLETGILKGLIKFDEGQNFVTIPIPPLSKQKEIAQHITGIRREAQELKHKTMLALERASKEIEDILFG